MVKLQVTAKRLQADLQAVAAREQRLRRRRRLALRRGQKGSQGVRLHRLRARQGREAVLAARRRGRRPGVGSLQADVRQVLGAVPAQVLPIRSQYSPPPESPHRITTRVVLQTHIREGRVTKAQIYEANTTPPPPRRTCVSGRGPGAGRKEKRARANYVCAIPRALASPFDPGRHSYEKSPREIPEAAHHIKTPRRTYGATFVCGCSAPG